MKVEIVTPAIALATLIGLALVTAPRVPAASAPSVTIEHFAFLPKALTVATGTTVTWVNHDKEIHTATSRTGTFASSGLDPDETFSHRFTTPGTYTYFCALHPRMTATIIVK